MTEPTCEIVWGARAIGELIGRSERQAFYLLEKGQIPGAIKIGKTWTARRSTLLRPWAEAGNA